MSTATSERRVQPATPATFDLWAASYDTQVNPLCSLEERMLAALLPELRGQHVLDAGCGTGRHFSLLRARGAQDIVGIDSSSEMLRLARQHKGGDDTLQLLQGSCDALPLQDASIDLAVCSFVASYLPSLPRFATEMRRILRPGGTLFVADIHPGTAQTMGWRRSFRHNDDEVEIAWSPLSLDTIRGTFCERGFSERANLEPCFGAIEQAAFIRSGRGAYFASIAERPAIYVLALTRDEAPRDRGLVLQGARVAITPTDVVAQHIVFGNNRVLAISDAATQAAILDLHGYTLLPGLVNAHDHLEFALFPRLGAGPYRNSAEWAADIHRRDAEVIAQHRTVPRETRVHWGALRNLLCGVTTVCHHNPLLPLMRTADFPVRVVESMRWAHSLAVQPGLIEGATIDTGEPFILHAAEGVDAASAQEFAQLDRMDAIHAGTVLVHGLAMSTADVARLNVIGAALVCCPSSNAFLFDRIPAAELLEQVHHLALGSDSPLTAAGDLLDELRFAYSSLGLTPETLYRMVTTAPATILRLQRGEGTLRPGAVADCIAVRRRDMTPAHTVTALSWRDIELVVRDGRVFLASGTIFDRLPHELREGLEPLCVEGQTRWLRAHLKPLFEAAACVAQDGVLSLGGKRVWLADRL